MELKKELDKQLTEVYHVFKRGCGDFKQLASLDVGTVLYVYAFRPICTKYGTKFITYCKYKKGGDTEINYYWSNWELTEKLNDILQGRKNNLEIHNNLIYYTSDNYTLKPLLSETLTELYTAKHNHKQARLQNP